MAKQVKLTLVRSLIGRPKKHKACIECLGLKKMHQTVIVEDRPTIRGMIKKVEYLLNISEES